MGLQMSLGGLLVIWADASYLRLGGIVWAISSAVFFLWRSNVVFRRQAIASDRLYDRVGKFRLSKHYHATESATAARKRKMKRNG
ncbi:MAG TPA: hypothetical protein VF535_02075 [Allosphingosinicella sp.]|jgi:hypothetical protein